MLDRHWEKFPKYIAPLRLGLSLRGAIVLPDQVNLA